ncbi:MAG: hypothetical protein HQ491_11630 [Bacteroidetes bacterium]|nr:hypothetical protein [Bacteroidota bacterium]
MDQPLQIVSIFATCEEAGHSNADDLFFYGLIKNRIGLFDFFTAAYSKRQIETKYHLVDDNIYPISVENLGVGPTIKAIRSISVKANATVVFLGYSEKFVVLFVLINLFKKYHLVLVATNNISTGRVLTYRTKIKIFFILISFRLKKLLVHTNREKQLIKSVSEGIYLKTEVKKHHMMIPAEEGEPMDLTSGYAKPIISFFGPDKPDKPLQPLLDLIAADVESLFEYRLYNVDELVLRAEFDIPAYANIKISSERLSSERYTAAFKHTTLIFMSHNRSFDGKLSGNFCDCVAYCKPFISMDIEPIISYFSEYGAIGYAYDFSDPCWMASFLKGSSMSDLSKFRQNLVKMRSDHEQHIVEEDNARALSLC